MNCVRCDRTIYPGNWDVPSRDRHHGRGLCAHCYSAEDWAGGLIDYGRSIRTSAETAEEWRLLRAHGCTRAQAAARMGISVTALEQAVTRHNRATQTPAGKQPVGSHTGR